MVITAVKQTLHGVYEITSNVESAFFLRAEYLQLVDEQMLSVGHEFNDDETNDILNAALVYSIEVIAMGYLARAEQCRSGLFAKLVKKGLDRNCANMALDYLEQIGYLDDSRFAGAWLRNRSIDHAEGRFKLSMELASRGIRRETAERCLNEFFEEHNEIDLCRKAYKKISLHNRNQDKVMSSLQRLGFSLKEIRVAMKDGFD